MIEGRLSLWVAVAVLLTLVGCTTAGTSRSHILSQRETGKPMLPAGYEVQASLHLSRNSAQEDYLLAMSTAKHTFSAAFLTPQGIPVYRVEVVKGRTRVSAQTSIGELLNPAQILEYLELIYTADDDIRARVGNNWTWESSPSHRRFHRDNSGHSPSVNVSIRYSGSKPWYALATLADSRNDLKLTIRVLESHFVLPE